MLTTNDLKQIQKLIRSETTEIVGNELNPIKEDVTSLTKNVSLIGKRVSSLDNNVSSLDKKVTSLQKDMKTVKRSVSKIDKTSRVMLKMLNEDDVSLHKRVKRMEDHLGFTKV